MDTKSDKESHKDTVSHSHCALCGKLIEPKDAVMWNDVTQGLYHTMCFEKSVDLKKLVL